MSGDLRIHVRPELEDPPLLVAFSGWNDAGAAATTALRYVTEHLHTAPLAELDPEEFYDFTVCRPEVSVQSDGGRNTRWPTTEVRYASVGAGGEIVTLCGPEPHFRWRRFGLAIADLVAELGVQRVVMLGAYLADVVYSQPVQVTGHATRAEALAALGVELSRYEGPIGIVGVLAEALEERGCEVLSLWAGLPHYIDASPNPRGALALVQHLGRHLGVALDERPLQQRAAEFEERISQLVASDAELADYVRQLKRRHFAQ